MKGFLSKGVERSENGVLVDGHGSAPKLSPAVERAAGANGGPLQRAKTGGHEQSSD